MTTCNRCAAVYGGHRTEHCTACHETFSGNRSGDMHRVGEHGADRRCLTTAEMADRGMTQNTRGYWTTGRTMDAAAFRRFGKA